MARQGCRQLRWSHQAPILATFGPLHQPLGKGWEPPQAGWVWGCCFLSAAGMLTSTCPQPEEDEELPVGCREPAKEGQPGWEGALAAALTLEEPCRLVLSTPSTVLQDEEIQEVRDTPASTGTPTSPSPHNAAMATALPGTGPV